MEEIPDGWQEKVRLKLEAREREFTFIHDILEDDPIAPKLTQEIDAEDFEDIPTLIGRVASGELRSVDAIGHYIFRFRRNSVTLTEVLFNEALVRASELDAYQKEHGTIIGPLHGVPVTLKDQFNIKGYDSTLGYVDRAFNPATKDAVLVTMLKSLGAIVIAKTNLPQSIMWCETENPLWGLTTHPHIPEYTPGGSTGGEAVAVRMFASLLGWGTDIGGSIRIPAHMMGLYGLKPSSSRLPYRGVPVSTEGQEHVPSSVGPLTYRLSSLILAMKELIKLKPWEYDARCVPIPWREDIFQEFKSKPLTIGLLMDDGVVRPHPPITRVLLSLVEELREAGHDIVEWNADLHAECIEVMDKFYTADGGEDIRRDVLAGGEPFIPHVEALVNKGKPISVYEYWQLNKRKITLQQAYLEKWNQIATGKVDVVLMPPMPHTAVPHRACRWVGYTKVWNVLDYTAMVIPAGNVSSVDGYTPCNHMARNELDEWNAKLWIQEKETMIKQELPVGVQIVGRKLEEEKVLAISSIINELLHGKASK
ncbi:amidase [Daldinia sp. FL1419]|nr:amidase [Daldinia sp. FL1419]